MVVQIFFITTLFIAGISGKDATDDGPFCRRPLSYADGPRYPVFYPAKAKYSRGNLMYFRCLDGFQLIGNRIRVCDEKGNWSGKEPWCNRTSCPRSKVYHPEHGSYVGDSFRIGSSIRYECDPGYFLVGNKSIHCQENGNWSARNPFCRSKCEKTQCKEGMKCILDPKTSMPVCVCKEVYDCSFNFSPVCGSDGKTYTSRCLMGMVACKTGNNIEPTKNGSCTKGNGFGKQDCTPCPKIKICNALYTSGYSFLGKPEKVEAEEATYIVTFKIIETYKGHLRAGTSAKVYMKKRLSICSCIPRLPNAKVLVMGQYDVLESGEYVPFIDEVTFLRKFYSHKQLSLCWLYK